MSVATINIPHSSCRIEDCGFAKSRAKSPNDNGGRTKKLRLIFDVSSKESAAHLDALFPGASDLIATTAMEDGDALIIAKKKKPPEVTVDYRDPTNKTEVFKMVGASCTAPILRIAKKAEKVELVVTVTGTLTKPQLCAVDDYFKADGIGSIATTIVDVEEVAKDKPAKRGGKKGGKAHVEIGDDGDDDMQVQ